MKLSDNIVQLKKGAWTPEEDQKLIAFIKNYGINNWTLMPKAAGLSRSAKSCRLRWVNYLRPDIKRGRLTAEEIETILKLHKSLGIKWSEIAAQLPGRTDNEIKSFWHTHARKTMFKTVRGANPCKAKKIKPGKKSVDEVLYTSLPYGVEETNSESSIITMESTDQYFIAESYTPSKDSCPTIAEFDNSQINVCSFESLGEIDESFCTEAYSIEDFYVPEIAPGRCFEEPDFSYSTQAPNDDELTCFWFNIFMEAKNF